MRAGVLAAAIAAPLLGGCSARDSYVSAAVATPAGNWRIERAVDPITRAPLSSALLTTRASSNSAVPFPRPAMLQLTCFKGEPLVRFSFEFKVGSGRNSVLGYSFDETPGRETNARFLQDYKTAVIEDKAEVAPFVKELAAAKVLHVRIRSLNAGRTTAEYHLDGARAAIEAAFVECPLSGARRAQQ